jgi:hypothetical protein
MLASFADRKNDPHATDRSTTQRRGPVRTVVWEGRSREAPPYPVLQPHRRQCWVIPPKANSAFVAAMEDVLAV